MLIMIVLPLSLFAQEQGLVSNECGEVVNGKLVECNFTDFMILINTIIDFALFKISIPLAAIMFAYAGFSMITAQGSEGKTKAKNIFSSVVIGLIVAAAAWIIVKTLLSILGYDVSWIFDMRR